MPTYVAGCRNREAMVRTLVWTPHLLPVGHRHTQQPQNMSFLACRKVGASRQVQSLLTATVSTV